MRQKVLVALIDYPEILLLKRFNHGKQYYCLPGGGIDENETEEQTAVREMKEETNLDIILDRKLLTYANDKIDNMEHLYLATQHSGTLAITGEDLARQSPENNYSLEWVSLYELRYTDLLPAEIKEFIIKTYCMEFRWDKLVRDKLPEMIQARGRSCVWHRADDAEYWPELKKKLLEEAGEFAKTESIKEIADIEEVLRAICKYKNFSTKEVESIRKTRLHERGGYKKRIYLETSTGN